MCWKEAIAFIGEWVNNDVAPDERARFSEMAESDLLGLHEGNFARLQVRPSEFAAWQIEWENKKLLFPAPEERYDNSRDVVAFRHGTGPNEYRASSAKRRSMTISMEIVRTSLMYSDRITRPSKTWHEANIFPATLNRTEAC